MAGRFDDARDLANQGLDLARSHKERANEAWVLRLRGAITLQRDPPENEVAAEYYRQALAVAGELGMRPDVAHCHLGFGKLYARTGRHSKAYEHLATGATMYREMDMRFWLDQAEAEMRDEKDAVR